MNVLRHSDGTRIFRSRFTFPPDQLLQASLLPPEEVTVSCLSRRLPMTASTGSRWNPRRPLAVLATLTVSVLIGSTVSQYGATAGFSSPQIPIQDGISVLLVSDPTNCVVNTQPIETTPLLLRPSNSQAPALAASPPRTNASGHAPATDAPRLNEARRCAAWISTFNQHRQGPSVSPAPAHGLETTPLLLRAPSTAPVAGAGATGGSGGGSGGGGIRG
jgi:hypothetical protein